MSDYPYPGDDPADLASVSSTFDANVTNMQTLIKAVNDAESNIKGNWKGDTATAASGDVAKINKVLALTATDFKTSKTAVDTLHDALVPIRREVDDLRRQLATAQQTLRGEQEQYGRAGRFGEVNDMTPKQVVDYRNVIAGQEKKTQGDITALDNDYAALVRRANTATDTCSDALKATISGSTYDPSTSGVKGTNLDDILGLDSLGLLHRYQAGVDAKTAADDAKKLLTLQPGSPEAVKLAHDLAGLLHKYPDGDPDFSVPFLTQLGQDNLLKLTVYVAGLQDTGGDGKALGQDIGEIQRDLGTDLAAATHLLGKPNPNGVQQLDQAWVDELLKDGGKGYQTSVGGYYYDIKGFQSLGILLRTGDYGSSFLTQSGDALMNYEKSYPGDGYSSNTWYDLGAGVTPNLRLWWGAGDGKDVPRGLDPFDGWVAGMSNSSEAKQVLYDDVTAHTGDPDQIKNGGLLNYLLNDRDWSLRDVNSGQSNIGHYEDGETRNGLVDLGAMLDRTVQGTGHDPQSQAIYESMVHYLGNDQLNGRIGSSEFGNTDWMPPELRPFMGDIVAKNIDLTHNTLAGQAGSGGIDQQDMKRVLMDLGKDHGDGGGAVGVVKSAESSYVKELIAGKIRAGDDSYQSDGTGMAKMFAGLDFGSQTDASQAQIDADEKHNAMVDEIVGDFSKVVGFGADAGTDEIPGAGLVTGWAIDHATDSIEGALHHDGLGLVQAQNDDASDVSRHTFDSTLRQAAVTAVVPESVLKEAGLIGADGKMVVIDDKEIGTAGWKTVSDWLTAHGHSDALNLATHSDSDYSANYGDSAAHYLGSP